jgi:hypothetical protein
VPDQLVLAITGGGTKIIPRLFARPGASQWLLEATVPYHPASLRRYLLPHHASESANPQAPNLQALDPSVPSPAASAASETTARQLAVAAYERARLLLGAESPDNPVGLACTCALATGRTRRGNDRVFIAIHSGHRTLSLAADFGNEQSSRQWQEDRVVELILQSLDQFGIHNPTVAPAEETEPVSPSDSAPVTKTILAPEPWSLVAQGKHLAAISTSSAASTSAERADGTGGWLSIADPPVLSDALVFPGSFNPLHAGHTEMAAYAEKRFGKRVVFELAITNVDKPTLDFLSIDDRVRRLGEANWPVVLTRVAKFFEKAELFPGSVFLVGADTAVRIGDPRFYGDSESRRDAALRAFSNHGCRFLVFGRQGPDGFQSAEGLHFPASMADLCEPVAEIQFRNDISSTSIRNSIDP